MSTANFEATQLSAEPDADGLLVASVAAVTLDFERFMGSHRSDGAPTAVSLSTPRFEIPPSTTPFADALQVTLTDCLANANENGGATVEPVPGSVDKLLMIVPQCQLQVSTSADTTLIDVSFEQRVRLSHSRANQETAFRFPSNDLSLIPVAQPIPGTANIVLTPDDHARLGDMLEFVGYADTYRLGDDCVAEATCDEFSIDAGQFKQALAEHLAILTVRALGEALTRVRLAPIDLPWFMANPRLPSDFQYAWLPVRSGRTVFVENGNIVMQGRFGPGAIECELDEDCACRAQRDDFCFRNDMTCGVGLCQ